MAEHPGRVITEGDLAGLIWPLALTPSNLIAGFTIYPLNPGRITDSQKTPSTVYRYNGHSDDSQSIDSLSQQSSPSRSISPQKSWTSHSKSTRIDEILALPKSKTVPKKTRAGLTSMAECVQRVCFLQGRKKSQSGHGKKPHSVKEQSHNVLKFHITTNHSPLNISRHRKSELQKKHRKRTAAARVRACAKRSTAERDYFCGVCDTQYGLDDEVWIECNYCSV